jgi:hypothetical protein
MKINGTITDREVFIGSKRLSPYLSQKLYNHSPDGFNWGYGGSGPSQLALAILLHFTDKKFALSNYMDFKFEIIAALPHGDFEIEESVVTDWIKERKAA